MLNTVPIGFYWCSQRFFRSYFIKEDRNINEILMNSVREKTSASNERICKEEKAEFLIAQMAQIANDCFDCNQLSPLSAFFFLLQMKNKSQIYPL